MIFPKVINYHAIIPKRNGPSWEYDAIYQKDFAKQLSFLSKYLRFLHPEEVLLRIHKGIGFTFREVLLTFDDGYQNNLDYAAPVLKSLGITALIFLNTRNLGGKELLWFNYLKLMQQRKIIERYPEGLEAMSLKEINQYISLKKGNLLKLDELEKEQFVGADTENLVKKVREGLFVPGGHTSDHPKLIAESPNTIFNQIFKNRKFLNNLFERDIAFFAYPQGLVNNNVVAAVRRAGYKAAFVVSRYPKQQEPTPFTIPRVGVYKGGRSYLLGKLILNAYR